MDITLTLIWTACMDHFSTYPRYLHLSSTLLFILYNLDIYTFVVLLAAPQFVVLSCPTEVSFITLPLRLLPYLQYADRYLHRSIYHTVCGPFVPN